MEIIAQSKHQYQILKQNRLSKARYANFKANDMITFETTLTRTTGPAIPNNHVVYWNLYKNGQYLTRITQNELIKVFEIFDVKTLENSK